VGKRVSLLLPAVSGLRLCREALPPDEADGGRVSPLPGGVSKALRSPEPQSTWGKASEVLPLAIGVRQPLGWRLKSRRRIVMKKVALASTLMALTVILLALRRYRGEA